MWSRARRWAGANPAAATVTGVAMAAAAGGATYYYLLPALKRKAGEGMAWGQKKAIEKAASEFQKMQKRMQSEQKRTSHLRAIQTGYAQFAEVYVQELHARVMAAVAVDKHIGTVRALKKAGKSGDDPEMQAAWHRFKVAVLTRLLVSVYAMSLLVVLLGVLRTMFGKIAVRKKPPPAEGASTDTQLAVPGAEADGAGEDEASSTLHEAVRSAALEAATTRLLGEGLKRLSAVLAETVEKHTADWDLTQLVTDQKLHALYDDVRQQTEGADVAAGHPLAVYLAAPEDGAGEAAAGWGELKDEDGQPIDPEAVRGLLNQTYDILESPNSAVVIQAALEQMFAQVQEDEGATIFTGDADTDGTPKKDGIHLPLLMMKLKRGVCRNVVATEQNAYLTKLTGLAELKTLSETVYLTTAFASP